MFTMTLSEILYNILRNNSTHVKSRFKLNLIAFSILPYLPPAYVVRGKVIFILGNVCLFTIAGGEGYPISGLVAGGRGVPHPRSGWWGGTPSQVWSGGGGILGTPPWT